MYSYMKICVRFHASHIARPATSQLGLTHNFSCSSTETTAAPSLLADRYDRTDLHGKVRTRRYMPVPSLLAVDNSQRHSHSCVRVIFETRKHGLTRGLHSPPPSLAVALYLINRRSVYSRYPS